MTEEWEITRKKKMYVEIQVNTRIDVVPPRKVSSEVGLITR